MVRVLHNRHFVRLRGGEDREGHGHTAASTSRSSADLRLPRTSPARPALPGPSPCTKMTSPHGADRPRAWLLKSLSTTSPSWSPRVCTFPIGIKSGSEGFNPQANCVPAGGRGNLLSQGPRGGTSRSQAGFTGHRLGKLSFTGNLAGPNPTHPASSSTTLGSRPLLAP